ncbi:hypothetical protein BDE02_06G139200 [Populus trichocarpa]|nr:hypothetical protein BDE02_06G139200 [Populus trichocarpa]
MGVGSNDFGAVVWWFVTEIDRTWGLFGQHCGC